MTNNKSALRKVLDITLVLHALALAVALLVLLYMWGKNQERESGQAQKKCWNEIFAIIEASPKKKADWIKQTVADQSYGYGCMCYCEILELIKNGEADNEHTK